MAEMPEPKSANSAKEPNGAQSEPIFLLKDIPDFPKPTLKILDDAGIESIDQALELDEVGLLGIEGIGPAKVKEILKFCHSGKERDK